MGNLINQPVRGDDIVGFEHCSIVHLPPGYHSDITLILEILGMLYSRYTPTYGILPAIYAL